MAGKCMPLRLCKGTVSAMEIPSGHVSPQCIATEAFSTIFRPGYHKRVMPASNPVAIIVLATDHQVRAILWEQVAIFYKVNKGIGFLCGLKLLNMILSTKFMYVVADMLKNTLSKMSINQSNPVLSKERVRIPRTRRAGGAAMLWGRLPLDGVGSCRLFFTDDLHDNLSWVPASDKPHTFKSCFTHSSQVFFGRPGPFLPGTGLDLTLFISPLERMTCPNHLSRRFRTRMARSHIPSLASSSSIDGSSDGLTPQIQRIIARLLRHSRWRAVEVMGQVSVPRNIELRTLELNRRPLRSKGTGLDVSKGRFSRNLPQAHLHLAVAAAMQPPPALSMSPR